VIDTASIRRVLKQSSTAAGSVPVEEFRSLVQLLASSPAQVHLAQLSILQLASAAVAAFGGPGAAAWESMNKVEQELVQLAANGKDWSHL
jgi:hypothetical protein